MSQGPPPPSQFPPPYGGPPFQHDPRAMERAMAANKDFTTKAVIALVLYWLCFPIGLIANVAWFLEARDVEALTGREPSGKGCLFGLLLAFAMGIAICGAVFLLMLFAAAAQPPAPSGP